jgi:hypothetical protein
MAKQTVFSRQLESVDHRREENIVKKPTTLSFVAAAAAVTFAAGAMASSSVSPQAGHQRDLSPLMARTAAISLHPFGGGDYSENFDSYAVGSEIIGQGGWEGWEGGAGVGALVDDDFSVSPSNSLNVSTVTDIVHQFSGYTTGQYTVTAQQYIPTGFAGQSYFIIQNTYPVSTNWSTQVTFDSSTGQAANTGSSTGTIPYVTDEWVELRVEIDLDANTQTFFYDGQQLYSGTWTEEVSGGGALNIASINLFANGASPVYYDDISIEVAGGADFAVSLAADPDAQEGAAGDTVTYTVEVENTGVLDDTYDIDAVGTWTATPSVATLAVAAGATETFTVDVEIDSGAAPGDSDVTEVTATSQGDNAVSATIDLTTSVPAAGQDAIFCDGFEEGGDGSCDTGGGPGTNLAEGFEDIEALFTGDNPWIRVNNSDPEGPTQWAQNPGLLGDPAQQGGSAASTIVNNFESTDPAGVGTISAWLLTPEIDFSDSTTVSFWTRGFNPTAFPDRLELRVCAGTPCTDVGTSSADVGDFGTLLLSVNPNLVGADDPTGANGYPQVAFAQFTADSTDGLPTSGTGRIAFRYFVTDAGGAGANSSTIGVDTVEIVSP